MIGENALRALGRYAGSLQRLWNEHFVDQEIDSLRMPDKVLRYASVSGQHDGASRVVDSVAECRLDWCMIDFEGRDPHAAAFVGHSFTDVVRKELGAIASQAVVLNSHGDVVLVRLLQVGHHGAGAARAPDRKRHIPTRRDQPTRQPEIWKPYDVV